MAKEGADLTATRLPGLIMVGLLTLGACAQPGGERTQVHRAQRDFWAARRAQQRLDIYPDHQLSESCLNLYLDIAASYPLAQLPRPAPDDESIVMKVARVGAMASLRASVMLREQGETSRPLTLLTAACRDDLPLGAMVEHPLRGEKAALLAELGRSRESVAVRRSLLDGLAPGLDEESAAWPSDFVLDQPRAMLLEAQASGDSELLAETYAAVLDWVDRLIVLYPELDASWRGLLVAVDMATMLGDWTRADALLTRLAADFPHRQPWRAQLRRAALYREQLGDSVRAGEILAKLVREEKGEARLRAGLQWIRHLIDEKRSEEALAEIRLLRSVTSDRDLVAELLYLRGVVEMQADIIDEAIVHWMQAASSRPLSAPGLSARLAIARHWVEEGEIRFAARSLDGLLRSCRLRLRNDPGGSGADFARLTEARADSLLKTLPKSVPLVDDLLKKRSPSWR